MLSSNVGRGLHRSESLATQQVIAPARTSPQELKDSLTRVGMREFIESWERGAAPSVSRHGLVLQKGEKERQKPTAGQAPLASRAGASQGFAGFQALEFKNQIASLVFSNQLARRAVLERIVGRIHPLTDVARLHTSLDEGVKLLEAAAPLPVPKS